MKKRYKIKEVNKIKLKSYLSDADKKCNKGSGGNNRGKRNGIKHNNV